MDANFVELKADALAGGLIHTIGQEWMLISAGELGRFNLMTASWGGLGFLWQRPVCFCFVRPQRYTYEFMERAGAFSLAFFPPEYHAVLDYCGSVSGRDVDKAQACGLTPFEVATGVVGYVEARLIVAARKIYYQDLAPAQFLDPAIELIYPAHDFHRMYVGEIIRCLEKYEPE